MFETLFGSGMPLAARFFIAFLVVLGLIGLTAWLVRRFGANRLGGANARGRQPRLAVIDAATVDGRRRLVLIRRDNIEHLLMIGGPTDLVVEPNIVRAASAREVTRESPRAGATPEIPTRTTPAMDNGWPLQPLSEPAQVAAPRTYRAAATEEPWLAPEPGARPRPVENLGGFTADLPVRVTADLGAPPFRGEPQPRPAAAPAAAPAAPESATLAHQTDHNLAEMAQQLEAALRRAPMPEGRPPVSDPLAAQAAAPQAKVPDAAARAPIRDFKPRVEPKFESKPEAKFESRFEAKLESKPEPKFEAKPETKFDVKPETKPEPRLGPSPAPGKTPYDNLEEEMASLLGRPPGKS